MNATFLKPMTFALALLLSVPLAQMSMVSSAQAGPGRILGESRDDDAPRGHKMQRRDRSESRTNSNSRNSRSERRTTRTTTPRRTTSPPRTTTPRPSAVSPNARPVGPTRVVDRPGTTRTTRTNVRTRHTTSVRSTTHVHHTTSSDSRAHYTEPAAPRSPSASPLDSYLTLGLGMGGFAANQISESALPGNEFNLGLGVRGELLGFELGFHGGGYTFDRSVQGTDIAVMGLSGDLKLQPSLGIFEPYVMAGLGGYHFQDAFLQETALGGAVRLGGGLDLRFNSFGLGLRYLYNVYGFGNDLSFSDGLSARSESLGLNATFYF